MNTLDINNLELKLDLLLRKYDNLLKENQHLREQLALLKQRHTVLSDKTDKNQIVVTQIKRAISQLKEEMQ
jgi:cell division septum initiation protein DivIVA